MAGMTRMIRDLILAALLQEEEKKEQTKSGVVSRNHAGLRRFKQTGCTSGCKPSAIRSFPI